MRRILNNEATAPKERKILDPDVMSAKERRKETKKNAPGGKPKPTTAKGTRKFVGIVPGQLVRVSGERDTKFVVVSDPYREIKGERIPVTTRVAGKHPSMVDLLGPDGPRTVRLGWCIPFHG
jgi:hypothetical protein